jgi:glycogen debranching enzyme
MDRQAQFPFSPAQLFRSLTVLITPMGVQGSGGELFRGAIFGRDSLRVALDLLPWFPSVAETVIFSLAHYQATGANREADAYGPGQIPHEVRTLFLGPRKAGPRQLDIFNELAPRWGGSEDLLVYYGSVDATPQFVRLAGQYCRRYGLEILDETLRRADGSELTLRESVRAAVDWLETEIGRNDLPLLGFLRTNTEHGHRWQILQDGGTSVIHADGHLANANARIETTGLQGLAYDALTEAASIFGDDDPDAAARWTALASALQAATLEHLWMVAAGCFAMGLDRDPTTGARRQIGTLSAIQTELLETGIFDTLSGEDRARYVGGIVRIAHGPEFLTPAGIRSRGLRHRNLLPYPDYHGVMTCWGVTNSMYATGLARQGLHPLSADVVHRHIGMLAQAGALYEFLYADLDGIVRHPLHDATGNEPPDDVIAGTNRPETDQGWTLSFALREFMEAGDPLPDPPVAGSWQANLVDEIAARTPLADGFAPHPELMKDAWLDKAAAVRHEAAWLAAET